MLMALLLHSAMPSLTIDDRYVAPTPLCAAASRVWPRAAATAQLTPDRVRPGGKRSVGEQNVEYGFARSLLALSGKGGMHPKRTRCSGGSQEMCSMSVKAPFQAKQMEAH